MSAGAPARSPASRARRGLTLVELLLAVGLLAFLMVGVFALLDRSLALWRRGETRRALLGTSSSVIELLGGDLRGLEPGRAGDLVLEWVAFDTDGDGIAETKWPRLRLVRQASAAEVERVRRARRTDDADAPAPVPAAGRVEVVWVVEPASTVDPLARAEGVLFRGERLAGDQATKSYFAPDFFGTSNRAPAGSADEVSGGILWLEVLCASQTSVVHDGWDATSGPDGVATSWDAWSRARPDPDVHPWNQPAAGLARALDRPLLPRRVRVVLEVERARDRARRTRLSEPLLLGESSLRVDDPERVPRDPGSHVLVDAEWLEVTGVAGNEVSVLRARRGTQAASHAPGAMVHHGARLSSEVAVATHREDWDL